MLTGLLVLLHGEGGWPAKRRPNLGARQDVSCVPPDVSTPWPGRTPDQAQSGQNPRVADALEGLVSDPDVALEAMSALRQTVGNEAALPHLRRVRDDHQDPVARTNAERQVARAERAANR